MIINNINKLKSFTLSEVLIVIGVIGTVAAMTIPALIASNQESEYKSLFMKEYSIVQSAFRQAALDNGGTLAGYSSQVGNSYARADDLKALIMPYLSYIKECSVAQRAQCNPPEVVHKTYSGDDFPVDWSPPTTNYAYYSIFILKDGSIWWFFAYYEDMGACQSPWFKTNNSCGKLAIDTNGAKKPNQAGKDLFEFHIGSDGSVVPLGTQKDLFKNSYSKTIGYNPRANQMLGLSN